MSTESTPGYSPFPAKDVFAGSSLGGFQFNNGRSYRIFYQAISGAINAIFSDDYGVSWGGPRTMVTPGTAAMGTPLTSLIYGGTNSRTFYLSASQQVSMISVSSGSVSNGVLANGKLQAVAGSKLGAIVWTKAGTAYIRVYYQSSSNRIEEAAWNGSGDFVPNHTFPPPMLGSALAFINNAPNETEPSIRGYYEHSNNIAMEICWEWNRGWFPGGWTLLRPLENKSNMSATILPGDGNNQGRMHVYFTDNKQVVEKICSYGWQAAKVVPDVTVPGQGLLATSYYLNGDKNVLQTRIFYIGPNGLIHWKRCQNDVWITGNDATTTGKQPQVWC